MLMLKVVKHWSKKDGPGSCDPGQVINLPGTQFPYMSGSLPALKLCFVSITL